MMQELVCVGAATAFTALRFDPADKITQELSDI